MSEQEPIPAEITEVTSREVATTHYKPAISRADNGDPVLYPKGLVELGNQGIVFDAHGTLLWAGSPDGEKIRLGFVSQMLESIKIKRPRSEDDRRGIRSLPTRLIGAVRGFNKYDYAYPNLPPDFFVALANFYQDNNAGADDNNQPSEETEGQPIPAGITGAVHHRHHRGGQPRAEDIDTLYAQDRVSRGLPPTVRGDHETVRETDMRLRDGCGPITGRNLSVLDGPNW